MTIYKITNLVNGKMYVGQTIRELKDRWRQHCSASKKINRQLYRDMREFGTKSFEVTLIEKCASLQELGEREKHFITTLNTLYPNGYNFAEGGMARTSAPEVLVRIAISKRKSFTFLSPTGELVKTNNLKKFCQKRRLSYANMVAIHKNPRTTCKGWRASNYQGRTSKKGKRCAKSRARHIQSYLFFDPSGKRVDFCGNIRDFCEKYKLPDPGQMARVHKGKQSSYLGWKVIKKESSYEERV